jgi:signal transduction histidine kinase
VLLLGHDLTELEQAQRQALQAERLAVIGQMVAGLAHESRNALQRTQACLERLRWKVPDRPEALDLVDRARRAQDDLVRLFEDVRAYAAPVRVSPEPVDLAEVWREAWGQVTAAHPDRDARLAEEAGGVDLLCRADRFQLRQVFRNLFENSLAACPGPVRVTVSVTLVGRPSSPALRVSVRDNGPGLDAEQRRRLFEPFYTTKVKGCGLGMAIARRLVEAHAGDISVGDGGPGAEFVLVLPRRGK